MWQVQENSAHGTPDRRIHEDEKAADGSSRQQPSPRDGFAFRAGADFNANVHHSPRVVAQRSKIDVLQKAAGQGPVATPKEAIDKHSPIQLQPAPVQKKGKNSLQAQMTADELNAWAEDLRNDAAFSAILDAIRDYDSSRDGRPHHQNKMIEAILVQLTAWTSRLSAEIRELHQASLIKIQGMLQKEFNDTEVQAARLHRFTRDNNAPFEQMTEEGLLWSAESLEHSTKKMGLTGHAYFDRLSELNLGSMHEEIRARHYKPMGVLEWALATKQKIRDHQKPENYTPPWFKAFADRCRELLKGAVLSHYTTADRARLMLKNGGLRSKTMLEKDVATFSDNSSRYDIQGLANTGFIFLFIEMPGASERATRFGTDNGEKVDSARISIPISRAGVLDSAWIMLSDFAQREYPDIHTNRESTEIRSSLPTRNGDAGTGGNQPSPGLVRHFTQGLVDISSAIDPTRYIGIPGAIRNQAEGDRNSVQEYMGPAGKRQFPDRIFNNVLVGPNIIEGLSVRAALEVDRIGLVNPALAKALKTLSGDALMRFMTKDMARPQVMVPNSLKIDERDITVTKKEEEKKREVVSTPPSPETDIRPAISASAPLEDHDKEYKQPERREFSSRGEVIAYGLKRLERRRDAWRARSLEARANETPPDYVDRVNAIRSIVNAPPQISLAQLRAEVDTMIENARARWND